MKLGQILTANRRISNIEPQNVEGWNRYAQSFFYNIDRIPYFDIRYSAVLRFAVNEFSYEHLASLKPEAFSYLQQVVRKNPISA